MARPKKDDDKERNVCRLVAPCTPTFKNKVKIAIARLETEEASFIRAAVDEKMEREGLSDG